MTAKTNSPRIAYLTAEYPAVSHTFILREVEALRELGFDISTCTIRTVAPDQLRGPAEKAAAADTFKVLAAARNPLTLLRAQLPALSAPGRYFGALALAVRLRSPGLRAFFYQLFYFFEATVLARYLKAKGITHLHNHFSNASATVAMLAAHIANLPFSYTLHGPADLQEPQRWRLDEKTARAEFVACISYFARSQVMLYADPDHWHKLHIVHCGVRPELYQARAPRTDSTGNALVFIGRLAAVKGLRKLVGAFELALKSNPDLTLTIVGDGSERAWLEKATAKFGSAVTLTGARSQGEVANILAEHDVLVLPSFAEGLPVVLMEAMASGKPVIATQVAGVSELVQDGISGYVVPPGDVISLAERIVSLSQDRDLQNHFGIMGRSKVIADFDIRQEAARIGALFTEARGTDPRPGSVEVDVPAGARNAS